MPESARVGTVAGIAELAAFYADAPEGVRANMIFSADGAAAFGGRAGPLSSPVDQQLLKILRPSNKIALAVYFHQHADLATCVNVRSHRAFVRRA